MSKAFDRVMPLGLKYKILHLGLPAPVERMLCDLLEDRMARIRVGGHLGPALPLESRKAVCCPLPSTVFIPVTALFQMLILMYYTQMTSPR